MQMESNHYVFPLSSCLCERSKHNVMAKRAVANHSAHTGAGIFSSQSALEGAFSGVRKDACPQRVMLFLQLEIIQEN